MPGWIQAVIQVLQPSVPPARCTSEATPMQLGVVYERVRLRVRDVVTGTTCLVRGHRWARAGNIEYCARCSICTGCHPLYPGAPKGETGWWCSLETQVFAGPSQRIWVRCRHLPEEPRKEPKAGG